MAALTGLVYPAYRIADRLAGALPERAVPWVTGPVGAVATVVMGKRRRMVARHLQRVYGRVLGGDELRQATRTTFRSYAAYWLDTFRLARSDPEGLRNRLVAEGLGHLDDALDAQRGAVLATAHLGSWDLGGAWLAHQGYPLVAVVERIEPPRLLDWFRSVRQDLGMEVIVQGPTSGIA